MSHYKNKIKNVLVGITAISVFSLSAEASLFPAENSNFYYKIGGGEDFPMPAHLGTQTVNLSASNNIGLGYNCGSFSPYASITNTLNDVQNAFENIDKVIISQATSAITNFGMYELSRANPSAFNIFNNNLIGAHNLFSMTMKSCEAMQNSVSKGQNPFTDWATVSMGDDWKKHMGAAASNPNDLTQADANQAKKQVEQANGNNGIAWVGNQNAGGLGQAPVNVISDTVIAGYNTLLGRSETDKSAPNKSQDNAHLIETWPNPNAAANWIANVVGDETITTCASCAKSTKPALGLLPANQALAKTLTAQLQNMVAGNQAMDEKSLEAISAPGVMVNTQVIRAIQAMSPNEQAIITNKLGQDIASAKIIDQALLAKRLLQTGSRVPAIYANEPAQKSIQKAIAELDHEMNNLSFDIDMRRKVVSNTIMDILQNQQAQAAAASATPRILNNAAPIMQDGAIKKDDAQSMKRK